jgi:hypothetical protein
MCHLELHQTVREFLDLLFTLESTDDGREFHPNRLVSCRVMDSVRLEELVKKLLLLTRDQNSG